MAKIVANNNKSAYIKFSSFFTLESLYLYINFEIVNFLDITICEQINKRKIIDILKNI